MDLTMQAIEGSRQDLHIAGARVAPRSGRYIPSYDPTNAEPWYEVADAGAEDVDAAVQAARKAFLDPAWRRLTQTDRGKHQGAKQHVGDGFLTGVLGDQARYEIDDHRRRDNRCTDPRAGLGGGDHRDQEEPIDDQVRSPRHRRRGVGDQGQRSEHGDIDEQRQPQQPYGSDAGAQQIDR